ncbi:MAG: hypothetical protein AAB426_06245 [Myxococcota bacterium]
MNITEFLKKWDSVKVDGCITLDEVPKGAAEQLKVEYNSLPANWKYEVQENAMSPEVRKLIGLPDAKP